MDSEDRVKRKRATVLSWFLAPLMALALVLVASAAQAQDGSGIEIILPADMDAAERDAFLQALRDLDQPITVNDAETDAAAQPEETGFATIIGRFDDALAGIADMPATVSTWWRGLGANTAFLSVWACLALVLAGGGGVLAEWGVDHLLRRWRRSDTALQGARFAQRLGAAMGAFAFEIAGLIAFAAGMLLVGWLLLPATPGARSTLAIVVIAAFRIRLLLAIGRLLFEPHRPILRLLPMPDEDARKVWRGIVVAVLTAVIAQALRDVLVAAGTTPAAGAFLGILAAAVVFCGQVYMILEASVPIRRLLLTLVGEREGFAGAAMRLFAEVWQLLFIIFAIVIFVTTVYADLALESAAVTTASVGPLLLLILLPFVLTAYGALIEDLVIKDAEGTRRAVLGDVARTLGQGVILLATLAGVASSLGFSPFRGASGDLGDRMAGALFEAAAAILVGWALWHALKVFLEHEVPEEEEPSDEGMGKPGSRIATLLPVLRSFLFVTIVIIAGITALAALGIQIAPLLAGAGVIGLAIGFGAQTLVQDVITGLFYLVEDAFRQGEYIETDAGKGVVEKISVRSVRLRHHRGPLYTIPFGQMGNIVNHSRDWVKIKFLLTVPFDTDIEQVRKLIKRVGQEMLEDPVLGPLFLQPVKSQGVMEVGSSGFTIGVKFLSRPGEQFLIRREAYARIKQAFVENGIEFATPRVTVDSETASNEAGAAAAARAAAEAAKAEGG